MMHRIWRLPEAERTRYDLSSLRVVFHMAAPCPMWLKEAWIEWLGPDRVLELYGGTEAQSFSIITGGEWLEHRGSVGRPLMGEMRILDPDGRELPPGQVGEIWMRRGEDAPPSYRYVGAQAKSRPGNWESLGDLGSQGRRGLHLPQRSRDRHDPGRRRQRVPGRGRGRARRAPRRHLVLRDRAARRGVRQRRPRRSCRPPRRSTASELDAVPGRPARQVQAPAHVRVRGHAAPGGRRQGPADRAPRRQRIATRR